MISPIVLPGPVFLADTINQNGIQMVLVPAGTFTMGSNSGPSDAMPEHEVFLDTFYIDMYEVTNAAYSECVLAGVCPPPASLDSSTRVNYFDDPAYANFPVIHVTWEAANTYCTWRGARLPTEAEWEKAARWDPETGTVRTYPWGDDPPTNLLAAYGNNVTDVVQVGSYPNGVSAVGAYDMAGNVWEWVADWYDANYYASSPHDNPTGPASGSHRVFRGGAFDMAADRITGYYRAHQAPTFQSFGTGIRCAYTP